MERNTLKRTSRDTDEGGKMEQQYAVKALISFSHQLQLIIGYQY